MSKINMLKICSLLLISSVFIVIPSCKNNGKAKGSNQPSEQTVNSGTGNTSTNSSNSVSNSTTSSGNQGEVNYSMVVSFFSIGSGIDRPVANAFNELVRTYQEKYGNQFTAEKAGWGREGEVDFCIQLDKMKKIDAEEFKKKAAEILKKSEHVHSSENAPCSRRRK
jgi:hypothetical protein